MRSAAWVVVLSIAAAGEAAGAGWTVELETGGLAAGYEDVRIPGDSGTDISFTDELSADAAVYVRLRLGMSVGERHRLFVEAAPVTVESRGTVTSPVVFAGTTFPAATDLHGVFRFDTYRMLYRYTLKDDERGSAAVGVTLLVRDAAIRLSAPGIAGEDTNVGIVPLIGFSYTRQLSGPWRFVIDGNAAFAPQGRAEDILLAVQYRSSESLALSVGYRLIEGGADVEEVYTFAAFHHLALGATWTF